MIVTEMSARMATTCHCTPGDTSDGDMFKNGCKTCTRRQWRRREAGEYAPHLIKTYRNGNLWSPRVSGNIRHFQRVNRLALSAVLHPPTLQAPYGEQHSGAEGGQRGLSPAATMPYSQEGTSLNLQPGGQAIPQALLLTPPALPSRVCDHARLPAEGM